MTAHIMCNLIDNIKHKLDDEDYLNLMNGLKIHHEEETDKDKDIYIFDYIKQTHRYVTLNEELTHKIFTKKKRK